MRSFGKRASGERLERMKASPLWRDGAFRNVHPVLPGLRKPIAMPTVGEFLSCGGRKTPAAPLPPCDLKARMRGMWS